jgi:predicted outer membrane protein
MFRTSAARRGGVAVALATAVLILLPTPARADDPAPPAQLGAADMILLNGVRQAGLWEIPAGLMAAQKGTTERIRQVGQMIAEQHVKLDQLDVEAANKLGATLPATPTAQQQGFLTELQNNKGIQFDQSFVTRLRGAHGFIYPIIGAVRATTHNPVIRQLADQANIFVMNHMKMLESTGLVQYQKLPPAAMPPAQDMSTIGMAVSSAGMSQPLNPIVLWSLLGCAIGLAAFTFVRVRRARG